MYTGKPCRTCQHTVYWQDGVTGDCFECNPPVHLPELAHDAEELLAADEFKRHERIKSVEQAGTESSSQFDALIAKASDLKRMSIPRNEDALRQQAEQTAKDL